MSDKYLDFVSSSLGSKIASNIGLPVPAVLERYKQGQGYITGNLLIGGFGNSFLAGSIAKNLTKTTFDVYTLSDTLDYTTVLKQVGVSSRLFSDKDRVKAIVFDAAGIQTVEELQAVHTFFNPIMRSIAKNARIVILGKSPKSCTNPKQRTAQRSLVGFTKALAKEIRNGATANLIYVSEDAADAIDSTLQFFISTKSTFVSGQVVEIGGTNRGTTSTWDKPLAGKVALVTGAARGIGKSIAEVLSRDGAKVIVLDIEPAKADLEAVAQAIGGQAITGDITAADLPQRVVDFVKQNHTGIDIIVHNAGITKDKMLANMPAATWGLVMNINLSSQERFNDKFLAENAINNNGRIICVSSISGIAGNKGQTNYACSKSAVIGMVDSMAPIVQAKNITINAVAPGFIETKMTAMIPFTIREAGRRLSSLSQGGQPEDVAETISWFANPNSAAVNGNVIRVCGQSLIGA